MTLPPPLRSWAPARSLSLWSALVAGPALVAVPALRSAPALAESPDKQPVPRTEIGDSLRYGGGLSGGYPGAGLTGKAFVSGATGFAAHVSVWSDYLALSVQFEQDLVEMWDNELFALPVYVAIGGDLEFWLWSPLYGGALRLGGGASVGVDARLHDLPLSVFAEGGAGVAPISPCTAFADFESNGRGFCFVYPRIRVGARWYFQ